MSKTESNHPSRRSVLKAAGGVAAASALAAITAPQVYAAADETIRVALVGCGGRGTGAVENALRARGGPTRLVAMADVIKEKEQGSYDYLQNKFAKQMDVPEDRRFIGFDGYKKAMDSLRPGDVVILATPPAFRWVHFTYAIQKGLNVFMEKPVTVDGPSTRRMLKLADDAKAKNLKVGVGLMCRHCDARHELYKRIKGGEIGDLTLLRAYRQKGPEATCFSLPKPSDEKSELLWQIKRFHSFLWLSGGSYSDFLIHNIDECCWMKDAWPVKASGSGGRHYRGAHVDQNFDVYSVEYTFADGAKLLLEGRTMSGCSQQFASFAQGTKGSAVISVSSHTPARCRIATGQDPLDKNKVAWQYPNKEEPNPYDLEWDHLLDAIRNDKPYNEVKRGAEASLVTSMGRMAAHTGRVVTWDEMLNCEHEFAPEAAELTLDGASPLVADKGGKYPVPQPGIQTKREF
jgi:predicted dehydrogenase